MDFPHNFQHLAGGMVAATTMIANLAIDSEWLEAATNAPLMVVCLATLWYSYHQDRKRAEEREQQADRAAKDRKIQDEEDAEVRRILFEVLQQTSVLMTEVRDRVQRCPVVEYQEITKVRDTSGIPRSHRDYSSEKDVPRSQR